MLGKVKDTSDVHFPLKSILDDIFIKSIVWNFCSQERCKYSSMKLFAAKPSFCQEKIFLHARKPLKGRMLRAQHSCPHAALQFSWTVTRVKQDMHSVVMSAQAAEKLLHTVRISATCLVLQNLYSWQDFTAASWIREPLNALYMCSLVRSSLVRKGMLLALSASSFHRTGSQDDAFSRKNSHYRRWKHGSFARAWPS